MKTVTTPGRYGDGLGGHDLILLAKSTTTGRVSRTWAPEGRHKGSSLILRGPTRHHCRGEMGIGKTFIATATAHIAEFSRMLVSARTLKEYLSHYGLEEEDSEADDGLVG